MSNMATKMKLRTADGGEFEINREIARQSAVLENMMKDCGEASSEVPLLKINSEPFGKIIDWINHNQMKGEADDAAEADWLRAFFNVEKPLLLDVIHGAHFLQVNDLYEEGCKQVAAMLTAKNPDEIREEFNLVNDLSPEEEEQTRLENSWFKPEEED